MTVRNQDRRIVLLQQAAATYEFLGRKSWFGDNLYAEFFAGAKWPKQAERILAFSRPVHHYLALDFTHEVEKRNKRGHSLTSMMERCIRCQSSRASIYVLLRTQWVVITPG